VVYGQNRQDIDSSFSSLQGNHVILNLPNENGDDIWLECTSQSLPFGFLGDFTDNRNVLVISPKGGIIKRTPEYKNETNLQETNTSIILDEGGNAAATITIRSKAIQYYYKYHIENYSEKDLKEYYKTELWDYLNNLDIDKVKFENDKDSIAFTENIKASISTYASLNQGDYAFKVNPFNRNNYIPNRYRTRKLPFEIKRGYKDVDQVVFHIPDGYSFGELPPQKQLNSQFGDYTASFEKIDAKTLRYKRTLSLNKGTYPKDDYSAYRTFRKSIAKQENLTIILNKNEE